MTETRSHGSSCARWLVLLVWAACAAGCGESAAMPGAPNAGPAPQVTSPPQPVGQMPGDPAQPAPGAGEQTPAQPAAPMAPAADPMTSEPMAEPPGEVAEPGSDPGAAGAGAPPEEPGWELLIDGEWELPAGSEGYRCVALTLEEDLYLSGLQAIAPVGTHHTVLGVGAPSRADGSFDCSAGTLAPNMLFGSGVGTDTYRLPEGVALRVQAGQQLLLNLHLFNASTGPLSGRSGTRVQTVAADEVEHIADNILAGPTSLTIPPGSVTQSGGCTMSHDVNLISVFPHMHQLGVHMTATAHSSVAGDVVLHDGPYDFDLQTIYPIEEVEMKAGDRVTIECQYENDTDATVRFGDSSLAEMCFLGLFRYPAAQNSGYFICRN